ncbi:hypothetical protein IJ21_23880 [Paenibacillus sp. 32O-W]|uniref:hypothetical protein n=1 Tax=Paenibacillus sp. 32O-W TaxID=1695218 RepID=UPI00072226DC|nr:hypothetical protein [Paenibacillus sp. 32O-W]ALS27784.1 hypothetical protein IJ21_23880 [Paenibacillus sp. 32O-W]
MNLAEMLGYADIQQLSRIADVYRCECNGHSKHELIQSILATVGRSDVFEEQIGRLRLEDMRFLSTIIFESRNSFSLEELVAKVQQSRFGIEPDQPESAGEMPAKGRKKRGKPEWKQEPAAAWQSPRETILRFKHQGWLFNGHSGVHRYLFQVPEDLKMRFKESMRRKFAERLVYTGEPPAYRDEQHLLADDIRRFLHYVHHYDVPLTSDGSMYKRSVQQLTELLGVREELPKGGWRFGYGRKFKEYPSRMSLLYDYCYFAKWLDESGPVLALTPAGLERLQSAEREETAKLYRFWIRLYKGAIPNLQALVGWIDSLADRWVTAESLKQVLTPFIKPFYYDSEEAIFEQRIVAMMLHLGLLRVGESEEGEVVLRMTAGGRSAVAGVRVEDGDRIALS